jgi:hypothetical protein
MNNGITEMTKLNRVQNHIKLFRDYFVQRNDCYPLQYGYNGGGYKVVHRKLSNQIIERHLKGELTIGLYCTPNGFSKWLCIDIDNLEKSAVREVQNHARRFHIPYTTEFSGKKGYHLWVFFDSLYPNRIARALASVFSFNHEIFPKQDRITPGKLGNLVKAPLGIHQGTGKRCLFLNHDLNPEQDQYDVLTSFKRINPIQIMKTEMPEIWSRIHQDFKKTSHAKPSQYSNQIPLIKDCVRIAILNGTIRGRRNQIGHIIASELRNSGMHILTSENLLVKIWNQQNNPPLEYRELKRIIDSAYGKKRYRYGCRIGGPLRQLLNCIGPNTCIYVSAIKALKGKW